MNLSYLSFYSQYLNSPVTKFHKINITYKISTIFLILIIIPYINNENLSFMVILLSYLFFSTINKSDKKLLFIKKNYISLFALIYSLFAYKNLSQELLHHKFCQNYYIPYKIKEISLKKNTYIIHYMIVLFLCYSIPTFIIKIFIIHTLYLEIITVLLISTKYECIISFFLKYLQKIQLSHSEYQYLFIIVISFTSQFLERIIYNLDNLYYSIQFRYNYLHTLNIIIYRLLNKYMLNMLNDTNNISTNLWNREITIKHFYN
uniref:Uncharacterized protein n=1 Tax=Cumathamnion serrulatum TaxID=1206573 RepID=A0A7U1AQY7_9FLOR|nr:hypothetical protein K4Y23_pgp016 [Cumathamnion serrulatum]QQY85299.1 hypothetical protein [Cumathamnion serrulatum]